MADPITGNFPSAASPYVGTQRVSGSSWYEALASAWGQALDRQANEIEATSNLIGVDGSDRPSDVTKLTAQAQRLSFISNSASSSIDSVGKALETMARKG